MRPAAIDVTVQSRVQYMREYMHTAAIPKAPTSSTATMVPTARAVGLPKNLMKCGPVITPDMTLRSRASMTFNTDFRHWSLRAHP